MVRILLSLFLRLFPKHGRPVHQLYLAVLYPAKLYLDTLTDQFRILYLSLTQTFLPMLASSILVVQYAAGSNA